MLVLLLLSFTILCAGAYSADGYWTVVLQGDKYVLESGNNPSGVSWAYYSDAIPTTGTTFIANRRSLSKGWSKLSITTNPKYSDTQQMHAAGYIVHFFSFNSFMRSRKAP